VDPEAFSKAVRAILAGEKAMTLATCSDGAPWAAAVYFAPDGLDLIFYSSASSRHCRDLALNPACAAEAHPDAASWREIRGIQMEGTAIPVSGSAGKARALACYLAKFPFAKELMRSPREMGKLAAGAVPYRFRPWLIRYQDNSLGFAARFSMAVENGVLSGPARPEEG